MSDHLRDALEKIAWIRGPGPIPKVVSGELLKQIESIALSALKASPQQDKGTDNAE